MSEGTQGETGGETRRTKFEDLLFNLLTNGLMYVALGVLAAIGTFYLLNRNYIKILERQASAGAQTEMQAYHAGNVERERWSRTDTANRVLAAATFTNFLFDVNPRARYLDIMHRYRLSETIRGQYERDKIRQSGQEFFEPREERRWTVEKLDFSEGDDSVITVQGIQYRNLSADRKEPRLFIVRIKLSFNPTFPPTAIGEGYIGTQLYEVAAFTVRDDKLNVVEKYGEMDEGGLPTTAAPGPQGATVRDYPSPRDIAAFVEDKSQEHRRQNKLNRFTQGASSVV